MFDLINMNSSSERLKTMGFSSDPHFSDGVLIHIAVPSLDLDLSENFYTNALGAKLFRSYSDRRTYGLANLQLVTHLSNPSHIPRNPEIYPRHFGITFIDLSRFNDAVDRCLVHKAPTILPVQSRFEGLAEQHLTFITMDPDHNIIEFKHYVNSQMAF